MRSGWIKIGLLTIFCHIFLINPLHSEEILKNQVIKKDKHLSGRVVIEGKLVVEKGATLFIEPGTQVLFKYLDEDGDGISETSIWVYGNIIARGKSDSRILFTSHEKEKKWGDWKEIQINHCKGFLFEHIEFQYSEYGLHVHFSDGVVKNCIFRYNNDCTRLGNSKMIFKKNLFEKNSGKALNFTNCHIIFEDNLVRDNREGIFVFEKRGDPRIKGNNIYNNFKNIKTGDFFKETLILEENYVYPEDAIEGQISVKFASEPFYGCMPDHKEAYLIFSIKTDGFVDGKGTIKNDRFYFTSFDGHAYEANLKSYDVRKFSMDDFSDVSPLVYEDRLFYQNWNGKIAAIDLKSSEKIFETVFDKSPKDDHRNPSPVLYEEKAIFLSPGGSLIVVDVKRLKEIFRTKLEGEFRATPLIFSDKLYIPSVDGAVYKMELNNYNLTKINLDESFYSSPVNYKNMIVMAGKGGKIFFLDEKMMPIKTIDTERAFRYQSPAVYKDGLIIASLDGYIIEFNEHKIIAEKRLEDIFTSTPVIYRDFAVLTSFYGNIYFYNQQKQIKIENLGEIQFMPAVYKDIIIVGSRANRLYGIKIW